MVTLKYIVIELLNKRHLAIRGRVWAKATAGESSQQQKYSEEPLNKLE